jgi:hypothetical protein
LSYFAASSGGVPLGIIQQCAVPDFDPCRSHEHLRSYGPTVSANDTNGYYSAGLDLTEIDTGSKDYVFLSALSDGEPASCSSTFGTGCVMGFDVTSGTISSSTTPTAATTEAGGTSGILIDHTSTFPGASNIYDTPLAVLPEFRYERWLRHSDFAIDALQRLVSTPTFRGDVPLDGCPAHQASSRHLP